MRAFIAVELPDALRQEVAAFQSELGSSGADVKWVEAGNLHLTLKFLGETGENQVGPLKEGLISAALQLSPFTVSLEGIGAFPSTTNPRVVWVGVAQGKEELIRLAQTVEQSCSRLGFAPEERPFSPHLTIGRLRSRERLAPLIKKLQVAELRGGTSTRVDRLILFQSTLSPQGPTYTPLADIPF
ncbi:MAG: RNA 2',3'-cyclic phosphodiesterase [Candidatus Omnitrophica bacterium]|nr:RNA 2',3'-cyclic phosphodiesterase [Candidatus Omnitrophota bacterium]